jgi:hypothetical protein
VERHRSVLAQLRHTARQVTDSPSAALSVAVAVTGLPRYDALVRIPHHGSMTRRPLPSAGFRQKQFPSFQGTMRRSDFSTPVSPHFVFLRLAIPSRHSTFALHATECNSMKPGVDDPVAPSGTLSRKRRGDLPSSQETLMCLRPALGPRRDQPPRSLREVGAAPRPFNSGDSPREVISGLDPTASALAVYASQCGSLRPTQDSLLAARPALPDGIGYP